MQERPKQRAQKVSSERNFPWLPLGLVLLVALVLRLVQLNHAPHFDEFYHLLAANSLLEDGDLCIADCLASYDRGAAFTVLVAGAIGLLGNSMIAARLVSVLAGLLLVSGVFWWTWRVAGRTAAWSAALLLALAPEAIFISQFIRFYAWHGLLVWIGAATLYFAVHPPSEALGRSRIALVGIGLLALLAALSLQITTLIASMGICVWLLIDPIADWVIRRAKRNPLRVAMSSLGVLVVVAVIGIAVLQTDSLQLVLQRYRSTNLLTAPRSNDIRFYHNMLLNAYPTLYSLVPIAFLIALTRRPSAAKFCGAMFAVALVVHSGGGFKAPRFLFYAMPFFFILWGVALSVMLPPLVSGTRDAMATWMGSAANSRLATVTTSSMLALAVTAFLATNSAFNTTYKMVTVSDNEWPMSKPYFRGKPDWRPALAELREWSQEADLLITSASVKGIYYLGRSDAELSVSRMLGRSGFVPDFSRDPRVGVPVLRSVAAMSQLMACYPSGLVIIEVFASGIPTWSVAPETIQYIVARTEELSLPPGSGVRVFRWRTDVGPTADGCTPMPLSTSPVELATG